MILDIDCQNIMLNNFMYIVKNIINIIHFFNQSVDSSNPNTWNGWKHVAFVGEVDLEKHTATIYEGGGYFIIGRNFKRVINTDKTTKKLAGWKGWGAVRVIELS